MPFVSVVVPTYNAAKYLPETIYSILEQDFDDIEIIVVDDCSTDNIKEVLDGICTDKIRYFGLETNHGGPSLPRNLGIQKARGEFIALCDSDDLFCPGRISSAVQLLLGHPELALVFTDEQKFDDTSGKIIGNFLDNYDQFRGLPKQEIGDDYFIIKSENAFSCLLRENYIMPSGVTIRRSILKDIGGFDETLTNGDDWDLWFRITRIFPIGYIDKIGFRYRIRSDGVSGRGPSLAKNRIRVLQKQMETELPETIFSQFQKKLALHYFGIGYHYQNNGEMEHARKYYFESLKTTTNLPAIKGILISLLGKHIFLKLKQVKERLNR